MDVMQMMAGLVIIALLVWATVATQRRAKREREIARLLRQAATRGDELGRRHAKAIRDIVAHSYSSQLRGGK